MFGIVFSLRQSRISRKEKFGHNGLKDLARPVDQTLRCLFFGRLPTMGNRVKGKQKKKSIKAAKSSSMGSKRKLSRMGKKQKKDHAGLDATFLSR